MSVARAISVEQRVHYGKGLDKVNLSVGIQVELFTHDRMGRAVTLHGWETDFVAEDGYTGAYLNGVRVQPRPRIGNGRTVQQTSVEVDYDQTRSGAVRVQGDVRLLALPLQRAGAHDGDQTTGRSGALDARLSSRRYIRGS